MTLRRPLSQAVPLCLAALAATLGGPAAAQVIRDDFFVTNGPINAAVLSGNTLYIGGSFPQVAPATGGAGVQRLHLAALDATTGALEPWNPGPDGPIFGLAVHGTTVYAGGDFGSINGQSRLYVAALDGVTGEVKAWNAGDIEGLHGAEIFTIAPTDAAVYIGGYFNEIGGQYRDNLAALDAATGAILPWHPDASYKIHALAVSGNTVYVGGTFDAIGGQTRHNIAAVDAVTGLATAWDPNANSTVVALALSGNTVYAGGPFTTIGGAARGYVAALDATSGQATEWHPNADNTVGALAVTPQAIYAGGGFTQIGGQARNRLAALDPVVGFATPWSADANGYVNTLVASGGAVYAGGFFTAVDELPRSYLAATGSVVTGVPEPGRTPVAGVQLTSGPNPFHDTARIFYQLPSPAVVSLTLYDVSGRPVRTLFGARTEPAGWHEAGLDGRRLASGIYFLKLEVGSASRTIKVLRME